MSLPALAACGGHHSAPPETTTLSLAPASAPGAITVPQPKHLHPPEFTPSKRR